MPTQIGNLGCPWLALVVIAATSCTPLGSRTPAVEDPDAAIEAGPADADGGGTDGAAGTAAGRGGRAGEGGAGARGSAGSSGARAAGGAGSAAGAGGRAGQSAGVGGQNETAGSPAPSGPCPDGRAPAEETCDGQDNDCDERTDEGLMRACGPDAQGICKPGVETCEAGSWSACNGAVEAKTEACDAESLDENCDGARNEGCTCTEGMMQPCGNDRGICTPGTQTCTNGNWSTECSGATTPRTEVCDPQRLDENCDGEVNENCQCENGRTEICSGSDVGACRPGMRTCADGRWGSCAGLVTARAEVCDGVDNDCDGTTDDAAVGCGANQRCVDGECACVPQCQGKVCGPDGCGGNCAPNGCSAAQSCENGQCVNNCGNGRIDPGEGCDDGVNSETSECPRCQTAFCGDGFILAGVEECEQRASGWGSDTCSPFCARTVYQKCDGTQAACAATPNANCSIWASSDLDAATCAPACNNDSSLCPAPGGFQATCAVLYCALMCRDGICPNKMRCARDVPIPEPSGNTRILDICVAGP